MRFPCLPAFLCNQLLSPTKWDFPLAQAVKKVTYNVIVDLNDIISDMMLDQEDGSAVRYPKVVMTARTTTRGGKLVLCVLMQSVPPRDMFLLPYGPLRSSRCLPSIHIVR